MAAHNRSVSSKQIRHLALCKPHGIFLQLHFKLGIAIFRSKEYDGWAVIRNNSILFHTSSSLLYLFHILIIFPAISLRSQSGSSTSTFSPFHNISSWKSKVGRRGQHCPSIGGWVPQMLSSVPCRLYSLSTQACWFDSVPYMHNSIWLIKMNLLQNYGNGMPFTFTPRQKLHIVNTCGLWASIDIANIKKIIESRIDPLRI